MISLNQIVKNKDKADKKVTVLDHLNLSIIQGEFISMVGFNKCGKSALIRILSMLDRDFYGNYEFNNVLLEALDKKSFEEFRIQNVGLVYKNFNLIDYFTIRENISLPLQFIKKNKTEARDRAMEICHRFKINHKKNRLASQVTQLIKVKTSIAQALILNPKILLVDDILNGLNNQETREIINLLAELNETGLTIVLTSENLNDANLFHRKIFINDGKVFTDFPLKDN